MAETLRGTGIVWGADGQTFTGGIASGDQTSEAQSIQLTRDSQKAEIANGDGETIGVVYYNAKKSLRVTVVPTGSSISTAVTSLTSYAVGAAAIVTVATAEGVTDDVYLVASSTTNRTPDGPVTVDLELEAWDGSSEVSQTVPA